MGVTIISKKKNSSHLDDFIEWQENQYNPVHYTGGKLHPFYKAEGNQLLLAIWMFVNAGFGILGYYGVVRTLHLTDDIVAFVVVTVVLLLLSLLFIWIGIRYLRKHRARKRLNEQRRRQRGHRRRK